MESRLNPPRARRGFFSQDDFDLDVATPSSLASHVTKSYSQRVSRFPKLVIYYHDITHFSKFHFAQDPGQDARSRLQCQL